VTQSLHNSPLGLGAFNACAKGLSIGIVATSTTLNNGQQRKHERVVCETTASANGLKKGLTGWHTGHLHTELAEQPIGRSSTLTVDTGFNSGLSTTEHLMNINDCKSVQVCCQGYQVE
jgi:hypothetical protein